MGSSRGGIGEEQNHDNLPAINLPDNVIRIADCGEIASLTVDRDADGPADLSEPVTLRLPAMSGLFVEVV